MTGIMHYIKAYACKNETQIQQQGKFQPIPGIENLVEKYIGK